MLFIAALILCSLVPRLDGSTLPSSELRAKYGDRALAALKRLLDFFESDTNDVNLDGLYGLRIAQGQLSALHATLVSDEKHRIQPLLTQIDQIANKSLEEIAEKTSAYLKRFASLTSKPFVVDYQPSQLNHDLIEHGERTAQFDEDESDGCFAELLGSTDRANASRCSITQPCWKLMIAPRAKDYRITHQLLWFLTAQSIGCLEHRSVSKSAKKNLHSLADRFCTNIYEDAKTNFQNDENQDLLLEQILLCSIVGYEEFLRADWLHAIFTWQNAEHGCFADETAPVISSRVPKRQLLVEQEMNHGCLSHKSGLAAGVLATYARAYLQ